jgi:arsenate reductase-like glutaredoxin family protein
MLKQPLSEAELKELAAKLGGGIRRPIIDTGKVIVAGFTAATREQLAAKG